MSEMPALVPWMQEFLRHLRRNGNVDLCADLAGRARATVYIHRARNSVFAQEWEVALHVYRQERTDRRLRERGLSSTERVALRS